MNILITGGAGYVGYSVTKRMAEKYPESKIIIYDSFVKARIENFGPLLSKYSNIVLIPWEKADIRDEQNFTEVVKKFTPETVIHLAAIVDAFTTNREGKDVECMKVNYEATVRLAQISKEYKVKNFFFQSSVSIYSRGEELSEQSTIEPLSTYGKSKYLAEEDIYKLIDGTFKAVSLRSATIVGYNPSFRYETIINLLCVRAVFGIETTIFESALKNPKTYLTLDDEVTAIELLIGEIDTISGTSYNAKSFHVGLEEVIDEIKKYIPEVKYKIVEQKTINQQVYTINDDKIRNIGFNSQGTIAETIRFTIEGLLRIKKYNESNFL